VVTESRKRYRTKKEAKDFSPAPAISYYKYGKLVCPVHPSPTKGQLPGIFFR